MADETERLGALVGCWRTWGSTIETPGAPAVDVDAIDTYEWLPGRAGLLHSVDARMDEAPVEGAEVIGWDPARDAYVTQYFGTDGPNAYEARLEDRDGALVWTMRSALDRFTGTFSEDGDTIDGRWERRDDGAWRPWMRITLTKLPA